MNLCNALSFLRRLKSKQIPHPTASRALRTLMEKGILTEATGGGYRRLYVYSRYLNTLNET